MVEDKTRENGATFTDKLGTVLKKRLPDVKGLLVCERLTAGANKETYRIVLETDKGERRLAMRRMPGGVSAPTVIGNAGLSTEATLLTCAREAGVPEPEVFYVLVPEDGLGEAFIMEWMDGETLGARIVRSEALAAVRPQLAYQCGQIMARIHAVDLERTGLSKILDTMTPEELVDQTWDRYKELNTPQPMIDYAGRWLKDHLPDHAGTTLVHNDFRNGYIMVGPQGVVAVLDWELAPYRRSHAGSGMDLHQLVAFRGEATCPSAASGTYEDLFRGYEDTSGRPVDREHVKFWEVYGSFWWAVGCLRMADHYRSGYDKTVERLAIGRRSSECQVDCVNLLIPRSGNACGR